MRKTLTATLSLVFALGLMAGPALADGRNLDRGNWLSGVAEPVSLQPGSVTLHDLNDDGEPDYVRVRHNIANDYDGYSTLVQREPNRIGGGNRVTENPDEFNDAWLSILGPTGPGVSHRGTFSWYYEVDEDVWVSLTFQFDGEGNLLDVNGVTPE